MESLGVQTVQGLRKLGTIRTTLIWQWSPSKSPIASNPLSTETTLKRLHWHYSSRSRTTSLTSRFKRSVPTMNTPFLETICAYWHTDGRLMKTIQSTELSTSAANYLNKMVGVQSRTCSPTRYMHLHVVLVDRQSNSYHLHPIRRLKRLRQP